MSMRYYPVLIEELDEMEGGGFVAYVPDLPGCKSDGKTRQEALANVDDAIHCWITAAREMGREIPEPRAHHEELA
jgi:antitoxin HicB